MKMSVSDKSGSLDDILVRLAELEKLKDQFDIREAIEAYAHGCDRADRDAVADIYHEDGFDDHGPLKGPGHQFATECVDALLANYLTCNHLLGQSRIRVTGDVAGAETLFFATMTRDQDGTIMMDQTMGRYVDRFERRAGVWRITLRRCVKEWSMTIPYGESYGSRDAFIRGERSSKDLSYEALGLARGNSRIRH